MKKIFSIIIVSLFAAVVLLQGGFGAWGERFDGSVDIIAADRFPNERNTALEEKESTTKQAISNTAICINDNKGASSNKLASNGTAKTGARVGVGVATATTTKTMRETTSFSMSESLEIQMGDSTSNSNSNSNCNSEAISEAAVQLESKIEKK